MLILGALLSSGLANRNKVETGKPQRDDKATPFLSLTETGFLVEGEINSATTALHELSEYYTIVYKV